VNSGNRVKRLRDLLEQLERLPPSAERDRMLREVRARVVDVDTGADPQALRTVDPDLPSLLAPRAGVATTPYEDRRPRRATPRPPRPRPVRVPAGEALPKVAAEGSARGAADLLALAADELLFLDDSASFEASDAQADRAGAPWTRGLRG
jgi:hypothetical protein